jgi:hypothetical protein
MSPYELQQSMGPRAAAWGQRGGCRCHMSLWGGSLAPTHPNPTGQGAEGKLKNGGNPVRHIIGWVVDSDTTTSSVLISCLSSHGDMRELLLNT